jgi:hypothetical protein
MHTLQAKLQAAEAQCQVGALRLNALDEVGGQYDSTCSPALTRAAVVGWCCPSCVRWPSSQFNCPHAVCHARVLSLVQIQQATITKAADVNAELEAMRKEFEVSAGPPVRGVMLCRVCV